LLLTCGLHPKNDIYATKPSDFDLRPDGGCQLPCEHRLVKCGHTCTLKCHTFDPEHNDYVCPKKCDKIIARCGHQCKQQCSHESDCNKCGILVEKIVPECGHKIKIRCDREPTRQDCLEKCPNVLACGHMCTKVCGIVNCGPCLTRVDLDLTCKHGGRVSVACSECEVWIAQIKCDTMCNQDLECGHKCQKKCANCLGGYIHDRCSEKCDRILFCGHKCKVWNTIIYIKLFYFIAIRIETDL
jgi:hypothetical protein